MPDLTVSSTVDTLMQATTAAAARTAIGAAASADLSTKADLVGGLVPSEQLPALALTATVVVANAAARLALSNTAAKGKIVVESDTGKSYGLISGGSAANAGDWVQVGDRDIALADVSGLVTALADKQANVTTAQVRVAVTGNATTDGTALLSAYTAAKALTPSGSALSATNRAAVILPKGIYSLGTTPLVLDTQYVDILGETGHWQDVTITSAITASSSGTVVQTVDDVRKVGLRLVNTADTRATSTSTDASAFVPYQSPTIAVTANATTNAFTATAHGLALGQRVIFSGTTLPGGIVASRAYYVCNTTANTFQVSFGEGLYVPIDLTSTGTGVLVRRALTNGICEAICFDNGVQSWAHQQGVVFSETYRACTGNGYFFGGLDSNMSGNFTDCYGDTLFLAGNAFVMSGVFEDCWATSIYGGFGGEASSTLSGWFYRCRAGGYSYGQGGTLSGYFEDCYGGENSFGYLGTCSGTFVRCKAGNSSFSVDTTFSGTAIDCVAGDYSFCSDGNFTGTAIGCIVGISGFGAGSIPGKLYYCRLTYGTFAAPSGSGKLVYCVDGNNDTVGAVAWGDITGKPSTFSPSSHTHAIADITNLQTTLDGIAARTVVADANYTILATDRTVAVTSITARRTLTLPAASTFEAGQELMIVDESGSANYWFSIRVAPNGSDTIDGLNDYFDINMPYGFLALRSNGSNGWIATARPIVTGDLLHYLARRDAFAMDCDFWLNNNNVSSGSSIYSVSGGQYLVDTSVQTAPVGRVRLCAGTTAASSDRAAARYVNDAIFFGTGVWRCEIKLRIDTIPTASDDHLIHAGFCDSITATPVDGVYFAVDRSLSTTNWYVQTSNNSTRTSTDTGVAVQTTADVLLGIEVNAAGTSAKFYIDGSLVATITTNIPTTLARATGLIAKYHRTAHSAMANSNPILTIDRWRMHYLATTPRS